MTRFTKEELAKSRKGLLEELEEKKRHLTTSFGEALVCPEEFPEAVNTIGISCSEEIKFCPLCGAELGELTKRADNNVEWEH